MGENEFIGPKGSKSKKESAESKTEVLLQKRKNGILSESEFLLELSKLVSTLDKIHKI
jgi:hypothetical protein